MQEGSINKIMNGLISIFKLPFEFLKKDIEFYLKNFRDHLP